MASIPTRQHKTTSTFWAAIFLICFMSAFASLPPKSKLDRWGTFCFCRVCIAVKQHNSNAHTYITTFVIFNMVPVYLGLCSSYGLRVTSNPHITSSVTGISARQTTLWVRVQFITRRERAASTQTLQLKLPI